MDRIRNIVLGSAGQTTAEYALVLLVVGVVVGVFTAFIRGGGLDGFFEAIVDRLPTGAE